MIQKESFLFVSQQFQLKHSRKPDAPDTSLTCAKAGGQTPQRPLRALVQS
ncbi:hypothetical protein CHCC14809_2127 [Bacillus licheniformis]|nr:hypothetical protein CHCC14809_2127 [Bacillus licheniformis]